MPSVPLVLESGHFMEISQGLGHDVQWVQRVPGSRMDDSSLKDASLRRNSQLSLGDVLR